MAVGKKKFDVCGSTRELRAGLVDGENYVNLRDMMDLLGFTVGHDDASKLVSIGLSNLNIAVNGTKAQIPGVIAVGNTLASLRPTAESLGAVVGYDDATKQISVTKQCSCQ